MKRREIRELVYKALFAVLTSQDDPLFQLGYIADDWEMAGYEEGQQGLSDVLMKDAYCKGLLAGVLSHAEELDAILQAYSYEWDIDRLGNAERTVLRIGLYEMLFEEKLHPAIAINEAVDLIKKYGEPEAFRLVNGILGKKAEELKGSNV